MLETLATISKELSRLERAIMVEDAALSPPIPHPLGTLSAAVLEHLEHLDVDSPSSVAEALGISFPATSRVLRKLSSRGFVDVRKSAVDGRGREIAITAAGLEALGVQQAARQNAIKRIFSGWHEDEVATLASSLARLNDRVAVVWRESVLARESAADDSASETELTAQSNQ